MVKHRYTRKDCIEALKRVANELDKSPTIIEYNQHSLDSEPSENVINRNFDCWNKAKQQAGLSVSKYNSEYTRKDCIEALKRVANELDKSPSINDYNQHKLDSEPSSGTIRTKFDCWNQAKQQAGLKTEYTKQDCIEALRRVANRIDSSPTKSDYEKYRREKEPSYLTIRSKFNGWNNAKQQAGLSIFYKRHTEEDCLEALKRVANELDKSPSLKEYKQHKLDSEPSENVLNRNFDCWNKAKQQAGLSVSPWDTYEYTKKDCIEAIKRVATELDKSPSIREYNQHKLDSEPSGHTIHRIFDDWNKAKQQAGLSVSKK